MAGLEPCISLAKGAHVMFIMNLWTDVGLCNADNQQPSDLPQAVIVKFDEDAAVSSSLPSIASLQEVSTEQLVQIKAKVSNTSDIKQIESRYGQTLD